MSLIVLILFHKAMLHLALGSDCSYYFTLNDSSRPLGATDCTQSLTSVLVRISAWVCEKVASVMGLGGGFRRVLRFSPLLTTV